MSRKSENHTQTASRTQQTTQHRMHNIQRRLKAH